MMLHCGRKIPLLPLVIAASMLAGCGATAAPPPTATAAPPTAAVPSATGTKVPYGWTFPEIARISLSDAKAAYDEGTAIFMDVRQPFEYEHEHIKGATNIYFRRLFQYMGELDKQVWIITYCACPHEEDSARAASILLENGFSKVTPMLGGLTAWKDAGLPVEP